MRKKWSVLGLIIAMCLLTACKTQNQSEETGNPSSDENVTNVTPAPSNTEEASKKKENELKEADLLLQHLIFEGDEKIVNENVNVKDLGTYVETLGGDVINGVDESGKAVKVIQLFWQCKDSKSLEYGSWFGKEQWAAKLIYKEDQLVGYDAFPCEYLMLKVAMKQTSNLSTDNFEAAYYLTSKDYQSIISKKEFVAEWKNKTEKYGKLIGIKSYYYDYNTYVSYPYVTAVWEFEKGDVSSTFMFTPGAMYISDVVLGEGEKVTNTALYTDATAEPVEDLEYWQETLESFSSSKYDLTASLTGMALKDACKDYFKVGVGITGSWIGDSAVKSPEFMTLVKKHFSSATSTNLMKPSYILKQEKSMANAAAGVEDPVLTFETVDPILTWSKDNGMKMRGHTLVWHNQIPDWFFREGYTNNGAYVSRETMLYRLESYIRQYLTYVQENYPGVVYCWDVVNEAVDPDQGDKNSFYSCRTVHNEGKDENLWYKVIGDDYVEQAFTYARKYAAEGVSLFYNDFSTTGKEKRDYIYALCEDLKSKGLIDGIGMQGYWSVGYPSLGEIKEAINTYAKLGLEIQITELTIDAPNTTEKGFEDQAARYADIFRLLQRLDTEGGGNANITCVSTFGLMDGYMFSQNDKTTSRFFDTNLQPKLAFQRILETMLIYY